MPSRLGRIAVVALAVVLAAPAAAQERAGLVGDLIRDVTDVQKKLTGLARAIPADKQAWRPGAGVRSVSEVLLHVASDNYFIPAGMGVQPPASTGITATDFAALGRFEKRQLSTDATVAELDTSFAHLVKAMRETPDARLEDRVKFFGQDMSVRQVWLLTATHLHEHLGQLIAYARSNQVVPPWSRQGS
jgi:uncharacterized damage-inducible protein DinB